MEERRRSAVVRSATEVFDEWAVDGKDVGMERGHAPAVGELLGEALGALSIAGKDKWTAIDAGCGNGWVVRRVRGLPGCTHAAGVDGAESMVQRAREIDPDGDYRHADLAEWVPESPVDLVHSMEVLYYLDDIPRFLQRVRTKWLVPGGVFVFGVDHYAENESSLTWPDQVGVRMTTLTGDAWQSALEDAGFDVVHRWLAAHKEGWAGTLSFVARA